MAMNPNSAAFADQIIERFIPLWRGVLFCISWGERGGVGYRYQSIPAHWNSIYGWTGSWEGAGKQWLLGQKCLSQREGWSGFVPFETGRHARSSRLCRLFNSGTSPCIRLHAFVGGFKRRMGIRIPVWVKNSRFEAIPSRFSKSFFKVVENSFESVYFHRWNEIRRNWRKLEEISSTNEVRDGNVGYFEIGVEKKREKVLVAGDRFFNAIRIGSN